MQVSETPVKSSEEAQPFLLNGVEAHSGIIVSADSDSAACSSESCECGSGAGECAHVPQEPVGQP